MHEPTEKSTKYQSFLLRLWCDHTDQSWRASALNVQSSETIVFPDIQQLIEFLLAQTAHKSQPGTHSGPSNHQ